jgi:hypothetical protein
MLFPGAAGCRDAVLVDLCAAYRCLGARMASMTGVGSPPFGEAFGCQAGVEEGLQQSGQGQVGGAGLAPGPAGGPGRLGPVAVQIAGADHDWS